MDFTNLKILSIGGVKLQNLSIGGVQVWTKSTYKNLVPTAATANGGTTIFNGTGYKDNSYVSGSNQNPNTTTNPPVVSTGFISLPSYDRNSLPTIYVKGISLDYSSTSPYSRCRIYFNKDTTTYETQVFSGTSGYWSVTKISDKYYSIAPTSACFSNYGAFTSFRVSGVGYGKDLIVTVNEPIE
ncbi:MAG: hypothetical protein J6R77_06390 [Clostridia bacterium]|nr:hypothetical protein [Clostridia bacterium]